MAGLAAAHELRCPAELILDDGYNPDLIRQQEYERRIESELEERESTTTRKGKKVGRDEAYDDPEE